MAMMSDEDLSALVRAVQADGDGAVDALQAAVGQWPEDARVRFLHGSVLAGLGRHVEAHDSMAAAVRLAPDFAVARFQYGLFQLTSGEADEALETWGRLDRLPDGHYFRSFVDGLRALIRDDFALAIERLEAGIASNQENLPLNRDMAMLIGKCREQLQANGDADEADMESETALLLRQAGPPSGPH